MDVYVSFNLIGIPHAIHSLILFTNLQEQGGGALEGVGS